MTVCLPTFLRSHGLWNSFAVLDALSDSDWHEHYSLTLFFAGWWTLIDAGVCSSFGPDAFLLHEQLCQRGITCRNSVCLSHACFMTKPKKLPTLEIRCQPLCCVLLQIQTSYRNLVLVTEYHVDCWQTLQWRLQWQISGATNWSQK